jgi:hypothetical protein
MTSSRGRPPRATGRRGGPGSPPSSTRTRTVPPRSGTTTTRSACAAQRLRRPRRLLPHPRRSRGRQGRARQPERSHSRPPGSGPREGDKFPPNKTYFEIPIAIQDRAFNADGSLFYPDSREFFDGATASDPGFIPKTDLSPIWNPEFFGNTIMVNGNTWPFLTVQQRRYRFRFLNGCQSRFLILDFTQIPGEGLADRQRRRLPRRAREPDRRQLQPSADGSGRARRPDRGLHQRSGGSARPRQRRAGRALRRRRTPR